MVCYPHSFHSISGIRQRFRFPVRAERHDTHTLRHQNSLRYFNTKNIQMDSISIAEFPPILNSHPPKGTLVVVICDHLKKKLARIEKYRGAYTHIHTHTLIYIYIWVAYSVSMQQTLNFPS
jgi:methionine synthase II (cobalamin-independent)